MLRFPVNEQYTSYVWLLDEEGNPVTGGAANITCTVIDESEGLFSNPVVSEVDSTNAPGLYKANFTPDALCFWKVFWDSTVTDADVSGGEVILVCDDAVDESDVISIPESDVTEKEITGYVTTPWSTYYGRRRTHKGTFFDLTLVLADPSAPNV